MPTDSGAHEERKAREAPHQLMTAFAHIDGAEAHDARLKAGGREQGCQGEPGEGVGIVAELDRAEGAGQEDLGQRGHPQTGDVDREDSPAALQ